MSSGRLFRLARTMASTNGITRNGPRISINCDMGEVRSIQPRAMFIGEQLIASRATRGGSWARTMS